VPVRVFGSEYSDGNGAGRDMIRRHGTNASCSSSSNKSKAHSNIESQVMPTRRYTRAEQEAKSERLTVRRWGAATHARVSHAT
jgi:hypothetical protein